MNTSSPTFWSGIHTSPGGPPKTKWWDELFPASLATSTPSWLYEMSLVYEMKWHF